ncbi:MAG: creatininase family protein [Rhodospirillales bacterium]|nr:creatininase family protein [Rhodospirillales bacterium]
MTVTPGAWIEDLTWPEVAARIEHATVLIPIGARAKEHGPHLPMQTDYLVARALCDGVAKELPVLVAPVVDFGYYPAFVGYPGSQHLRPETFAAVLHDIIDGLIRHKARRIAIVNTGVSTEGPVTVVVRETLEKKGVRIPVANIRVLGSASRGLMRQKLGGHADEMETSVVMAIAPERVHLDRAVEDYGNMLNEPNTVFYVPAIFRDNPAAGPDHSVSGVRGDPRAATAEKGRSVLATMVGELVAGLRALGT